MQRMERWQRGFTLVALAASLVSSLLACGGARAGRGPDGRPDQALAARFARPANELGFDLFGRLRERPGNQVTSPASIALALHMTYAGARGETAAQMARVLHLGPAAGGAPHEAAAAALSSFRESGRGPVRLYVASRLFGDRRSTFRSAFLSVTRDLYGAPLEAADFHGSPDGARRRINRWVESQTHGRIRDLLGPATVSAETRLVLASAVYFLGRWEAEFEPAATAPSPFYLDGGRAVQVPTMHQQERLAYAAADGVQLLQMPYRGGAFAMVVLLPEDREGLAALEAEIDASRLEGWLGQLEPREVSVALPSFHLEPAGSIALGPELEALGMTDAFDPRRADLTGMAESPAGAPLYVGDLFHRAIVEVDERGTRAAAATAGVFAAAAAPAPLELVSFVADHPFLFLIRDLRSGAILFLGRVADPSAP